MHMRLNHRIREQARSHIGMHQAFRSRSRPTFSGVGSGSVKLANKRWLFAREWRISPERDGP